jgi:hypothetical protein
MMKYKELELSNNFLKIECPRIPVRRSKAPQTAEPTPFNGKRKPPQPEHALFTLKIQ